MNRYDDAWELFLRTGKVTDYMRYRQTLSVKAGEDDLIEGEEYPDADEYTGGGNWRPGY